MTLGDYLALSGLLVSASMYISFVIEERKKPLSAMRYFLSSHQGTSRQYGPSFAAASTSLATVFLFFVAATSTYGAYLFWCGISYFIGQFLFLHVMKAGHIKTTDLTTNAKFWLQQTNGLKSTKAIRAMTILSFIVILFLEFYIGSEILYYYIGSKSGIPKVAGFAFIVIVVIIYVGFGGMNVVLRSDRWQYILMVTACILLALFALAYDDSNPSKDVMSWVDNLPEVKASGLHLAIFLAWIGLQNITLPFTQLSSWQRLASMKSIDTALDGFKAVGAGFFALWLLPIIALLILTAKGAQITDVGTLFDTIKTVDNFLVATIYAVIFVGFASALFSTADSAMIALELSIAENISEKSETSIELADKKLNIIIAIIAMALISSYYFVEANIIEHFVTIIFVLFSQLAIIAPHMFVSLVRKAKNYPPISLSSLGDFVITLGIWGAWASLMCISLLPAYFGVPSEYAPMIGSFVGLGLATVALLIGFRLRSETQPEVLGSQDNV